MSVTVARPDRPADLPPVLAVHGFGSDADHTWAATGHLRALTRAGRTVIAPDLLGHGRSDKPHDPAAYSLPGMVDDLHRVAAHLGADVIDVLGYSLGARLSMAFAVRTGGTPVVRRLVLGGYDGRRLFDGISSATLRLALVDPQVLDGADAQTRRIARIAFALPHNDLSALAALIDGLPETATGLPDPLPQVPTLVVAGDEDPLADGAHRLADALPHGAFLPIPGRDHVSTLTAGAFRRAVVDFLATD